MMKVLIIEDEKPAARQLTKLLDEIGNIEVVNITDSIKSSVKWLKNNEQPELIFMDIQDFESALANVSASVIRKTDSNDIKVYLIKISDVKSKDVLSVSATMSARCE